MIEFTQRAREVLARAHAAATRLNADARIRLVLRGGTLASELTDQAGDDDTSVEVGEMTVYVAAGIDGVIDVEDPHDRLVLRAPPT